VGDSIARAAESASVNRRTVERWLDRGRLKLTPLARLASAADRPSVPKREPLTESDLVELLEAQARRGHVRAIELCSREQHAIKIMLMKMIPLLRWTSSRGRRLGRSKGA
jgi:hypothetical protein